MFLIEADNVNDAYYSALALIDTEGFTDESRNGLVLKFPGPLVTKYQFSHERVLFDAARDANPFLHLFEAMWMLSGSNDAQWIGQFGPNLLNFSDDGKTLHGAYGHRWREHFKVDQITGAIDELIRDPRSRRVVISMWDPYIDPPVAAAGGKDVPCNTQIYLNVRPDNTLSMTVCNRSNDLIWGLYGANAVHMSILHEYIALAVGIPMGDLVTISNDAHVYEKHFPLIKNTKPLDNPYQLLFSSLNTEPLWNRGGMMKETRADFDADVRKFIADPFQLENNFNTQYFRQTVSRMARTWSLHKSKMRESALAMADQIEAEDWKKAVKEWLGRRYAS